MSVDIVAVGDAAGETGNGVGRVLESLRILVGGPDTLMRRIDDFIIHIDDDVVRVGEGPGPGGGGVPVR